jgi:hypothetical protein
LAKQKNTILQPINSQYRIIISAVIVNLCLFFLISVLGHPIYDTEEDVYVLYLLSGGFGGAPTELLHYNHVMHPFLSVLLKNFFVWNDHINWYTLTLLFSHFAAVTSILTVLLRITRSIYALVSWVVLFTVFEARFLLAPNFTNAAIICSVAAWVVLFTAPDIGKAAIKYYVVSILLFIVGSLFRVHVMIPLIVVAVPFIFINSSRKKFIESLFTISVAAALIFLFNVLHQSYYRSKIPGWQTEESYRQSVYRFYNRQFQDVAAGHRWHTELGMINSGLPIDTSFLSIRKMNEMFADLSSERKDKKRVKGSSKNWFWINNRIFFILFFVLLIFSAANKKLLRSVGIVAVLSFLLGLYLLAHYKLPFYLLLSFFMLTCIFILLQSKESAKGDITWPKSGVLLLLLFWSVVQLYKIDRKNLAEITNFKLAYSELAKRPDYLFMNMAGGFPLQKFYVFDLPQRFPLQNLITGEHFLDNIQAPVFNRFDIRDSRTMYLNHNLFYSGKPVKALLEYFLQLEHIQLRFLKRTEFRANQVFVLTPESDQGTTSQ